MSISLQHIQNKDMNSKASTTYQLQAGRVLLVSFFDLSAYMLNYASMLIIITIIINNSFSCIL
jgi:hypothetical protein